jgi:hypothetical protein
MMADDGSDVPRVDLEEDRHICLSDTVILLEAGEPLEIRVETGGYVMLTNDWRLTLVVRHP